MALIAHVAVNDLIKSKRVGRVADLIEEQAARFPELTEMIGKFGLLSPEDALTLLSQYTGRTDLATFRQARNWIIDLQDELMSDDEGGDAETDADQQSGAAPNILHMASERAAS
jgi:hypothetical protein